MRSWPKSDLFRRVIRPRRGATTEYRWFREPDRTVGRMATDGDLVYVIQMWRSGEWVANADFDWIHAADVSADDIAAIVGAENLYAPASNVSFTKVWLTKRSRQVRGGGRWLTSVLRSLRRRWTRSPLASDIEPEMSSEEVRRAGVRIDLPFETASPNPQPIRYANGKTSDDPDKPWNRGGRGEDEDV